MGIKKWLEQRKEREYTLNGFRVNEESLDVARQTLRSFESELYRLERPPLDDISKNGRVVSESTVQTVASKYAWIKEKIGAAEEYEKRLQGVSDYFRRDKKLQIISSSFSMQLNALKREYSRMQEEHGITLP